MCNRERNDPPVAECYDIDSFERDKNQVMNESLEMNSTAEPQTPVNVRNSFLSLSTDPIDRSEFARKIVSDTTVFRGTDYDDLCGPWRFPDTPAFAPYDVPLVPQICTWLFIQALDITCMKQTQYNKRAILSLIENKLPNNLIFGAPNRDVFLELMWEVFRFTRDNGYTERGVSSLMGLFYLTHRFFLTSAWRTAAETFEFFKEGVMLHSVLRPPKSVEVFTPMECKQSLDFFREMYMRHLVLLRFACLPNYRLVLVLEQDLPQEEEEEKLLPQSPPPESASFDKKKKEKKTKKQK